MYFYHLKYAGSEYTITCIHTRVHAIRIIHEKLEYIMHVVTPSSSNLGEFQCTCLG